MKRSISLPDLTKVPKKQRFSLFDYDEEFGLRVDSIQLDYKDRIDNINKKTLTRQITTTIAPFGTILNEFKVNGNFTEDPCPICIKDKFEIAAVTNCGHFICDECLTFYLKHKEDNDSFSPLTCPTCREVITNIIYYVVENPDLDDEEFKLLQRLTVVHGPQVHDIVHPVQYGISHISDDFNPCITEIKIVETEQKEIIPEIHFILDISGSMSSILPYLKINLITYIKEQLLNGIISIDLFDHNYYSLLDPIKVSDNLDLIIEIINGIKLGGRTMLGNALHNFINITYPKWIASDISITKRPTVVILTDGATDDLNDSHQNFQDIKKDLNILLVGVGTGYSYDNCIKIVESNATVFEHISDITKFVPTLDTRIGSNYNKVKIITKDNNWIFTGAKKVQEDTQYVKNGVKLRFSTTNGCPTILINDEEVASIQNEKLNLESQSSLFEFLSVSLVNKIGSNAYCSNGLRMKLKLKKFKKFINSKILNLDVQQRILKFIKDITDICDNQMKYSVHYSYGHECLRGESSISVGRAVSTALRGCSSGGEY
jgi:uncharacterized protein YegL